MLMGNLWAWITVHWVTWVVPFLTGIFGAFIGATFKWFYPTRKEWKEERKAKEEAKVDEKVLGALFVGGFATGIFDAWQIAGATSLNHESVADSLERLEARGRVTRIEGTFDHPAPNWMYHNR